MRTVFSKENFENLSRKTDFSRIKILFEKQVNSFFILHFFEYQFSVRFPVCSLVENSSAEAMTPWPDKNRVF